MNPWPITVLNKTAFLSLIKVQFRLSVFNLNAERPLTEVSWWHSIVPLIYPGYPFEGIHYASLQPATTFPLCTENLGQNGV